MTSALGINNGANTYEGAGVCENGVRNGAGVQNTATRVVAVKLLVQTLVNVDKQYLCPVIKIKNKTNVCDRRISRIKANEVKCM